MHRRQRGEARAACGAVNLRRFPRCRARECGALAAAAAAAQQERAGAGYPGAAVLAAPPQW